MKSPTVLLLAVLMLVTAVYANSFDNGFHFDDSHAVVDNPAVRSLKNVPRFFTDASTFSVLPANQTYRPIVSTMLALDYAWGQGYVPFWFHITTFVLFLGLIALIYFLAHAVYDKVGTSPANSWLALFAAAWFGVHPVMAETVNYVIQRGDLYCTLGCVGALVAYARFPRLRRTGAYLLPLVFALLSKPPAAVFPALLFLYVFFFEEERSEQRWRTSFVAALPSIVVTAVLLMLQSAMTPPSFMPSIIDPWDYRLTQPFVWLRYLGSLALPLHLNVDTDLQPAGFVSLQTFVGLFALVLVLAGVWLSARRRRTYPIAFGLLWFVITQLPTSLYVLSEVENDHRMFFSFVGLMLAAVWGVGLVVERAAREMDRRAKTDVVASSRGRLLNVLVGMGALVALTGYASGTYVRNEVWHDSESLWRDAVEKSPRNGRALMNYGLTQMSKGAYPEALALFERALVFTPTYDVLEINLGIVTGAMAKQGHADRGAEAEQHFLRAIALKPQSDRTHSYYGRWLLENGRLDEAIAELQRAVALNPRRMLQRENLILALARAGDLAGSHEAAEAALAVDPNNATALKQMSSEAEAQQGAGFWLDLSFAQYSQQKYPQAIQSAQRALTINPESARAHNNIAASYAAMLQWDEAIAAAKKALVLQPDFELAKANLAWAQEQKREKAR